MTTIHQRRLAKKRQTKHRRTKPNEVRVAKRLRRRAERKPR